MNRPAPRVAVAGLAALVALAGCELSTPPDLTAPVDTVGAGVVHLAARLGAAEAESGSAPASAREERTWSFDAPQPAWRTLSSDDRRWLAGVRRETTADGVRLSLTAPKDPSWGIFVGGLVVDLGEGLRAGDWETVLVRARSDERFAGLTAVANAHEEGALPGPMVFFASPDLAPPIYSDGSVQTYAVPLVHDDAETRLQNVAVLFGAPGPASVEVLSVTLVPRGAAFRDDTGVRSVTRDGVTRETLYAHAPARLSFHVEVPAAGRLDVGLTVAEGDAVTYRVVARDGDGERRLLDETVRDAAAWAQRSVDLAAYAGRAIRLVLEAASETPGSVALWGAPVVAGADRGDRPNVVFYVIDGGDANLMSLYGYDRETTPFLAELAAEGAVFTRAHATSTWTQPSTVSFMTSLHHSVLGGLRRGIHSTAVPPGATTMAERFQDAGFLTASLTSNPNAGRLVGLDRGVDLLRDIETEHHSTSSLELHERFWTWRDAYPGGAFWVHFQTTDVHEPNEPEPPWAGRWVSEEERADLERWNGRIWQAAGADFGSTSIVAFYDRAIAKAGVPRHDFYDVRRGLYDETMAHQDHALESFVAELEERGEWERTILVVAADHGHPAGTFARFGRGLIEPRPADWQGALFDAYATRVPLLVIWPGEIAGGQRFTRPVSMVDVLPTLLDLARLPPAEVAQGRSLAPLLRGGELPERPVVLDEFRVDEASGELIGNLEVIDGKWGASLEIGPVPDGADPSRGRHAVPAGGRWGAVHPYFPDVPRLLLYDLENDPFATRAVNDEHPDLVRRYHRLLREHWEAHQALAQRFGDAADAPLTPEQLEQLRALGYIQ